MYNVFSIFCNQIFLIVQDSFILFNALLSLFCYFIFGGKIALWPPSCAVKMFVIEMLVAKMFKGIVLTAKIPDTFLNPSIKVSIRNAFLLQETKYKFKCLSLSGWFFSYSQKLTAGRESPAFLCGYETPHLKTPQLSLCSRKKKEAKETMSMVFIEKYMSSMYYTCSYMYYITGSHSYGG